LVSIAGSVLFVVCSISEDDARRTGTGAGGVSPDLEALRALMLFFLVTFPSRPLSLPVPVALSALRSGLVLGLLSDF